MGKAYYDIGLHVGDVLSQGLTTAGTGTAQFFMRVKVLGVPTADGNGYDPHKAQYERTIYWALTEGTMKFVVEKLQRLGFTGKSIAQLDPSSPEHQTFVGQQVELWCSHELDPKGGEREKWDISRGDAATAFAATPLDAKAVRQLDSLFGAALRANGTPRKATPAVTATSDGDPGITDADLPQDWL